MSAELNSSRCNDSSRSLTIGGFPTKDIEERRFPAAAATKDPYHRSWVEGACHHASH